MGKARVVLSEETRAKIRELVEGGRTYQQAATECNTTSTTVRRIMGVGIFARKKEIKRETPMLTEPLPLSRKASSSQITVIRGEIDDVIAVLKGIQ
jgi:hypothetical protein